MRTPSFLLAVLFASITYASEAVVTPLPTVDEALKACAYMESLSKKYLTYTAREDLFPILKSPLCVDWLRESRDIGRFRKLSSERIWKSRNGDFSVSASFAMSAKDGSVILRTPDGKEMAVEVIKLDNSSKPLARFLNEYATHIVRLSARTHVREKAYEGGRKRIAAGRSVVACVDESYFASIGLAKSAAIARELQKTPVAATLGVGAGRIVGSHASSFLWVVAATTRLTRIDLNAQCREQVIKSGGVYASLMELSARERRKLDLERLKNGLTPLEEFSFSEIDTIVADGLKQMSNAANESLEQEPRYFENVFGILPDEIAAIKTAQQVALNGREVSSLHSNFDAYWDSTPDRRRFYKSYWDELEKQAGSADNYATYLEGIRVYYSARLLEFRRLRGTTDIKKHRIDHQDFVDFISSYSFAPLSSQSGD